MVGDSDLRATGQCWNCDAPMSESEATPYVSFVTWGRNDGYTADYLARTAKALTCLVRQLEAAALASEIVVSEWNPPPERPLLVDSLDLPRTSPMSPSAAW